MAPSANLRELALAKSALRLRIACRRIRCADALVHLARPLRWIDRARVAQRRVTPWLVLIFLLVRQRQSGLALLRLVLRLLRARPAASPAC
jgi:hypothetical protein